MWHVYMSPKTYKWSGIFITKDGRYTLFSVLFSLSCKANTRVKPAKTGARPALFLIFVLFYVMLVFVSFSVLFVCICVLYYCHRLATQLQLTNISYQINLHRPMTTISILLCNLRLKQSSAVELKVSCWKWEILKNLKLNILNTALQFALKDQP
jgi:heme/copper-type cytochrome/quinol oxidase subunit 2